MAAGSNRVPRPAHLPVPNCALAVQHRAGARPSPGTSRGVSRVLIVSNRLPVTVRADADGVQVQPSVGGVATGLLGPHERSGGLWIGWTGLVEPLPDKDATALAAQLEAMRAIPVQLTQEEVHRYYESYSNGVLWPLFHYFASELPLEIEGFDDYERVNRRFADAVVEHYRPGDLVWVQDYHLMRVPALVRARAPRRAHRLLPPHPLPLLGDLPHPSPAGANPRGPARGGPRRLPHRRLCPALLVVGAADHRRVDRRWTASPGDGREVRLGVFPMGVDAGALGGAGRRPGGGGGDEDAPLRLGAAPRRHRPARLHQGHPAPAPRLRAAAAPAPGALRARAHGAGRRALAHRRGGVPGPARDGGRAGGAHQRPVRDAQLVAGALPGPRALASRGDRAVPRRGRAGGHPHPGRDEPRGEGVHRRSLRRRRSAGPLRVHRRRGRDGRGPPGQPVRPRGDRRGALAGAADAVRGAAHPDDRAARAGGDLRRAPVGPASSSTVWARTSDRRTRSDPRRSPRSPRPRRGSGRRPPRRCSSTTTGRWWSSRARRTSRCPMARCSPCSRRSPGATWSTW